MACALLSAMLIALEYGLKIKKTYVSSFYGEPSIYWRSMMYHAVPWLLALMALILFSKSKSQWLKSSQFWLLCIIAWLSFVLRSSFYEHHQFIHWFEHYTYGQRILNFLVLGPLLMCLPVLYWIVFDQNSFRLPYGLNPSEYPLNWKHYAQLLILMLPLIMGASLLNDFLKYYPRVARLYLEPNDWLRYLIFELFYGSDFIYIELFFRGFLILAFAQFIGAESILLAAVIYCSIHFGKPLGETISSFFGGLVLGTITYHTKSIKGGIFIHVGVAWLMELGGALGNIL